MTPRPRILIGKVGLDGHEVGARVVARTLADAGMEVIYSGIRQTPEQIVEAAIQEDADVIGVSILSGAHMTFFPRILKLLAQQGAADIPFIAGGVIPADDAAELKKMGVAEIFPPETNTAIIVEFVRDLLQARL